MLKIYKFSLILLMLIFTSRVWAVTDVDTPNSHVFYPDIVTMVKSLHKQNYAKIRIVVHTFDPNDNKTVAYYEPMFRDQITDLFSQTLVTKFLSPAGISENQDAVLKIVNDITEREVGRKLAKEIVMKNIMVE